MVKRKKRKKIKQVKNQIRNTTLGNFKKLPIDHNLYNPKDCLLNGAIVGSNDNSRYWEFFSFGENIIKEVFKLKNKYEIFLHDCYEKYGSNQLTSKPGMHLHHIIPIFELESAFNQSQDSKHKIFLQNLTKLNWNLVFLTVTDHAIAHTLRYEVYNKIQDKKSSCLLGSIKKTKRSSIKKSNSLHSSVFRTNFKTFKRFEKKKSWVGDTNPIEDKNSSYKESSVNSRKFYRNHRRKKFYDYGSNSDQSFSLKKSSPKQRKKRRR